MLSFFFYGMQRTRVNVHICSTGGQDSTSFGLGLLMGGGGRGRRTWMFEISPNVHLALICRVYFCNLIFRILPVLPAWSRCK